MDTDTTHSSPVNSCQEESIYDFSSKISNVIYGKIKQNTSKNDPKGLSKQFKDRKRRNMNVNEYLNKFISYMELEKSDIILAIILIDRLYENTQISINEENYFRLVLVALILACKYNKDVLYSNAVWSKIGGIKKESLNLLEVMFIKNIDYSLFVDKETFELYSSKFL